MIRRNMMRAAAKKRASAPSTMSRYWRVYITANNGDLYTSIQEIELRATVGGADVTTPSTVTGQSSYVGSSTAAKTVDNDFVTATWVSSSVAPPHWLSYDLGVPTDIRELAIWPQNNSSVLARSPKDFQVQTSPNGTTWTTVATFSNVTGWAAGVSKSFAIG